jgi:AsmA protein
VTRISGTGAMAVDVTGFGASQQAIMNSLGGTASVSAKDGTIQGVDLAAVSRTIQNALSGALGAATSQGASTDFAEAGGTFKIAQGVMQNQDFHLLNPFLRITGNGEIALGPRTIDFHVVPKLVASGQGRGGTKDAAGIAVPFEISGPWTKLSYKPDMKSLGGSLLNQVTKGGGLGGLLGGVLGGSKSKSGDSSSSSNDTSQKKKPGLNLGDLFGH